MSDVQATASRCVTCGADLPAEGAPCPACVIVEAPPADEVCIVEETLVVAVAPEACDENGEEECAPGALWVRIAVALVYLLVGAACAYGSLTFFDGNFTTSSDWIFGAMAIGLAVIALVGVKESLFPSKWTPE